MPPFIQRLSRLNKWWKWSAIFAAALSFALLFQACSGGDDTYSAGDKGAAPTESVGKGGAVDSLKAVSDEHSNDKPTPTPVAMAEPAVPVVGQDIAYATVDGESVTGYLARPENPEAEELPAIVAIHEWWGLNDNIEATARRLAGEGYTVLAVDLYDGEVAAEPERAKDLMRSVMDAPGPAQDNLTQAVQFLTDEYSAPAVGSIGWCFGGNWSLRAGLLLPDLDAIAIYYGQLILAPEALDGIAAPLIGFFGEDDSSIPVQDVENFEATLENLGKVSDINLYPDVGHAFANPSGQNYDADAAEDAWEKTTAFFKTHLQANLQANLQAS